MSEKNTMVQKLGTVSDLLYEPATSCKRQITTHYNKCSEAEVPVPWKHTERTFDWTLYLIPGLDFVLREGFLNKAEGSKLKQQQMRSMHCVMKDAGTVIREQGCHDY